MTDLGNLPQSWVTVNMGSVAEINPIRTTPALPPGVPVSFVPMAKVKEEFGGIDVSETRPWDGVHKGHTQFKESDVLFAKITPCMENGKLAVAPPLVNGWGYGSTEFHVLRPFSGVNPKWIAYYLAQEVVRREARANMTGTAGQLRVSSAWVRDRVVIPLAPTDEQQRVVTKIDELFTRLDAAVAALERVRANLKRYRAAVLKAAVEGKLTEAWREEHPEVEPASTLLQRILIERRHQWEEAELEKIGRVGKILPNGWQSKYREPSGVPDGQARIPEIWCWTTIENVSTLVTDGDHNPPPRTASGVPHLTARNVHRSQLDFTDCTFVSPEDAERVLTRYRPLPGDLIVTCVGTIGRTAIVPPGVVFSPDRNLAGIRPVISGVFVKYLEFYLCSPHVQTLLLNLSGSTAQPHLYLGDIRRLQLPLPPLEEQARIVSEVEWRLSLLEVVEVEVEAGLRRASLLRQSILKGAFEGKLVPQDASNEPASMLLERIRRERQQENSAGRQGSRGPLRAKRRQGIQVIQDSLFQTGGGDLDTTEGSA